MIGEPANKAIGILHPGSMGISIAASAQRRGWEVCWASEGRSLQTNRRAREFSLVDLGTVPRMARGCHLIVSVCPPAAAEDVARSVAACGYTGFYLDANAISPGRAMRIGEVVAAAGGRFVDGGIIGGPAWEPGGTWLYLSGEGAREIVSCFSAGPLETEVIGPAIGQASALKMCYAAWTKGTTALLTAITAAASAHGVWRDLQVQWERDWPGFPDQATGRVRRAAAKAWRFEGEMHEIADTFEVAGLPGGFHETAAEIFGRLAQFKGAPQPPGMEEVHRSLAGD